jgi:hypothetical protein
MNHQGIDLSSAYFQTWLVAPTLVQVILSWIFRIQNLWDFKTAKGLRGSDFMAFLIVAGSCVTYMSVGGVIGKFGFFNVDCIGDLERSVKSGTDPTFYGRSEFIENHVIYPMLAYQIWNAVFTLVTPEIFTAEMVAHHSVTALLAYFALNPYLQYYALFYFGLFELSNIPLTFVDFFDRFQYFAEKYPRLNEFCRVSFAVAFILLRLIAWPIVSKDFWVGSITHLMNGNGHSAIVIVFFLLANVFLTLLQFYFGWLILCQILKEDKQSLSNNKIKSITNSSDSTPCCCCTLFPFQQKTDIKEKKN